MLAIKNNIMAVNAARYLGQSYDALAKSVERLSSGMRINSAKDDAAGLAVRELMRADIAVLGQGARNAQDGVSLLQTMEGAMATIDSCLIRMKQLAEQASTGSYSEAQREIMDSEFAEMAAEVERISTSTKFNDITMLDNAEDVTIRFGTGDDDEINVSGADMTKAGLEIVTGSAGYEAVSGYGVADADAKTGDADAFLKLADNSSTDNTNLVLDIAFENELAVQVTLEGIVGDKYFSLNEVVEAINAVTLNLSVAGDGTVQAYAMASVEHDNTTGLNYIKLSSRTADAEDLTMTGTLGDKMTATLGIALTEGASGTVLGAGAGKLAAAEGTGINILDTDAANTALTAVTAAITAKDTARAAFGYKMNRLESTVSVLNIQTENLMAAESRISDVDVATEMAELTRNQVLAQAGTAMLAQANAIPQMALTLLR